MGNQDAKPSSLALTPKFLTTVVDSLQFQNTLTGSRTLRKVLFNVVFHAHLYVVIKLVFPTCRKYTHVGSVHTNDVRERWVFSHSIQESRASKWRLSSPLLSNSTSLTTACTPVMGVTLASLLYEPLMLSTGKPIPLLTLLKILSISQIREFLPSVYYIPPHTDAHAHTHKHKHCSAHSLTFFLVFTFTLNLPQAFGNVRRGACRRGCAWRKYQVIFAK